MYLYGDLLQVGCIIIIFLLQTWFFTDRDDPYFQNQTSEYDITL